jgi:hypothetical protein
MRMMMRVSIPVEQGNAAIKDGSLANAFQLFMDSAKPEAAYFVADRGKRTAYFFFDLKQPSDIPSIAEPFFAKLHAAIYVTPAMNPDDVKAGLEAAKSSTT